MDFVRLNFGAETVAKHIGFATVQMTAHGHLQRPRPSKTNGHDRGLT